MAGQEVPRAPTFSPIPGRQDQITKDREMQNEQSMSTQVDTDGRLHERPDFVRQEQEVQRGRTLSTSPTSVEGEKDSDFQPPARSKSQIDGEPKRRISTRRKVVDDEEAEPPRSSNGPSMEVRKRKAGSPQVQIAVKRSKTSRPPSEAGESVIVVGAPARDETVVETTEKEDGHKRDSKAVSGSRPTTDVAEDDADDDFDGETISKAEHEKRFQAKRAQFNQILREKNDAIRKLESNLEQSEQKLENIETRLESAETDRDKFQMDALRLNVKLDRMVTQEEEWFTAVPARMRAWKKQEAEKDKATLKGWFEKELQKEKNKMHKRFESQESRHKKEQAESSKNVKEWKAEITENRKIYEALEKELRKEADQRIKEMKPENQKELREKTKEINELHVQLKTLGTDLQKAKDDYDKVHTYAVDRKARCTELKTSCFQLQEEKNQALDKASTAEANYRGEKRHGNDLAKQFKTALQQQQQKFDLLNQNNTENQDALAGNQRSLFYMRQQNDRNNANVERLEKEVEALRKEKGAVEWKLQQQNQALKKGFEEKRSMSVPMTNKPQAQRQDAQSASAAAMKTSRSPSLHQGQQSRPPSVSSPQGVPIHRHAEASSMGSDRHRQSVPDPRTGSTDQGVGDQDATAAKDSKVVETVKEVHPHAEPKEGGPVDYRRLEVRDGGGREVVGRGAGDGGDVVGGVRVGEGSGGAAGQQGHQSSLFGRPGKQTFLANDRDSAGGGDDAMEDLRVGESPEVAATQPKHEPSASIFGMNRPAGTTEGDSTAAGGDAMEGLNIEAKTETAQVETGEDNATPPAGDEAKHNVQREGPHSQDGSAANVVTAADRSRLGELLANNPWSPFNRW